MANRCEFFSLLAWYNKEGKKLRPLRSKRLGGQFIFQILTHVEDIFQNLTHVEDFGFPKSL